MHTFTLKYQPSDSKGFILFWKDYYNEGKYSDIDYKFHLQKGKLLQKDDINFLLMWKNGGPLSEKKKRIRNKCIKNIDELNRFRKMNTVTDDDFDNFYNFISENVTAGFVWKIFIIHITRPDEYPIIDQHVFRAFSYITSKKIIDKPSLDKNSYLEYFNFIKNIARSSTLDFRTIDKALFAFGKFLKEYKLPLNKIRF